MTAINNPFNRLPQVPSFDVKSAAAVDGQALPPAQTSAAIGGQDVSPDLTWSGAPEGTRSFAVTVFDPDAPTMSGFWHWAVANIPATVTSLPAGAGDSTGPGLPAGAFQLANDAGLPQYIGAAPPAGHGEHRYFITVHALDVEDIGVPAGATPALLGFTMTGHILGRATIVATANCSS
ncbi:YbhB/YbcL family Raf kinase inhibitor-like protein [Actinoplanes sp. NPDC000266]